MGFRICQQCPQLPQQPLARKRVEQGRTITLPQPHTHTHCTDQLTPEDDGVNMPVNSHTLLHPSNMQATANLLRVEPLLTYSPLNMMAPTCQNQVPWKNTTMGRSSASSRLLGAVGRARTRGHKGAAEQRTRTVVQTQGTVSGQSAEPAKLRAEAWFAFGTMCCRGGRLLCLARSCCTCLLHNLWTLIAWECVLLLRAQ